MARKHLSDQGKPWKYEDDRFLVDYFGCMGDFIGIHDLGRAEGEATKRVVFLKETGAWGLIQKIEGIKRRADIKMYEREIEYAQAVGWKLKAKDFETFDGKSIYIGECPWRDEEDR